MSNITQRMLTKQLRGLESDDLIHREVYKGVPPKVEYNLTKQEESLKSTILSLENGVRVTKNKDNYSPVFKLASINLSKFPSNTLPVLVLSTPVRKSLILD